MITIEELGLECYFNPNEPQRSLVNLQWSQSTTNLVGGGGEMLVLGDQA